MSGASTAPPGYQSKTRHLVPLLLALTTLCGVVDATSYLTLGHVFVANMTGNIMLTGFAVAGAMDVSLIGQVIALASFFVGAALGGRLAIRVGGHRGRHLMWSTWIGAGLIAVALLLSLAHPHSVREPAAQLITSALALAMGVQNATARSLSVEDLKTNVITLTITGIAVSLWGRRADGDAPQFRRVAAVLLMFFGALCGGLLAVHAGQQWTLLLALGIAVAVAVTITRLAYGTPPDAWARLT